MKEYKTQKLAKIAKASLTIINIKEALFNLYKVKSVTKSLGLPESLEIFNITQALVKQKFKLEVFVANALKEYFKGLEFGDVFEFNNERLFIQFNKRFINHYSKKEIQLGYMVLPLLKTLEPEPVIELHAFDIYTGELKILPNSDQ